MIPDTTEKAREPRRWAAWEITDRIEQHDMEADLQFVLHSAYAERERECNALRVEMTVMKLAKEFNTLANTKDIFRGQGLVPVVERLERECERLRGLLTLALPLLRTYDDDPWKSVAERVENEVNKNQSK